VPNACSRIGFRRAVIFLLASGFWLLALLAALPVPTRRVDGIGFFRALPIEPGSPITQPSAGGEQHAN
jgi:hypothetical protein